MKPLDEQTLIVCGIVRDAEHGLRHNIPVIDALCKRVKDYHILIYENDSKDHTKALLSQWHQRDRGRIHVSLNDTDPTRTIPSARSVACNPFYSRRRIEKMARLRNQYMAYVDAQGWTADYMLVVDMDVAQLRLEGILDTLRSERAWDAVVANGYSTSPKLRRRYHDTYALTMWGDEANPQTEGKIRTWADRLGKLRPGDEWIRISSGFGGLAVYRFEAVSGLRYRVLPNADKRVEVRCEHFSLYAQMRDRGFDRFYINPAMELKYQRLTPQIVWESMIRQISSQISFSTKK